MYSRVHTIEFELSTICNSFCPTCIRFVNRDHKIIPNPLIEYNQNITIDDFVTAVSDPVVADNVNIEFIGTAGEPIAHPKFLTVLEKLLEIKPDCMVHIHTNGGIRNQRFFKALADALNKFRHYKMSFAIDGLEDTNHLYRKEVKWSKIMENLQAFIDAGGKATWKTVVFNWNAHQLADCQVLAESMGCVGFEIEDNYVPYLDSESCDINQFTIERQRIITKEDILNRNKKYDPPPQDAELDPYCKNVNNIFIAPDGQVYPCCMFSAAQYTDGADRTYFNDIYHGTDSLDFNLKHHSLSSILKNPWWAQLSDSIDKNPCDLCISHCEK